MPTKKTDDKKTAPPPAGFGAAWVNDTPEETPIADPTGETEEKTDG